VGGLVNALRDATSCESGTLREMGAKAREYVAAEFSWSATARSMIALYREVISNS
jgi:glycosyltransferase involved in cell wall biosynthesis